MSNRATGATGALPSFRIVGLAAAFCYALVLIVPYWLPRTGPFARTFNSMLDHLLRGRFDVDPAIVGDEGFLRAGHVYAYWGPIPAILRLPVTVLPGWRELDFTFPYCAVALFWMVTVKLWTVRFVVRQDAVPHRLAQAAILVVAFSGAQVCFLRFSLYQEVCLWAGLSAAVFVAAAVVACYRGLGEHERLVMALAAGAALLVRVSTGIGLVAAFVILLVVEAARDRSDWRGQLRRSAWPLVALAVAGLLTAGVNYGRWGDPLTFADYRYYLFNLKFPDRVARTAVHGLFAPERIPFGIVYYLFPIWVLPDGTGHLVLEATRLRLIDSAELPPSSFFLTDPLLLLLGSVAIAGWSRRGTPWRRQGCAVAVGLSIPPLLMLSAISMCFRYRMDFYPLIEFLAFSGLGMSGRGFPSDRIRLIRPLTALSILGSMAVGVAYLASKLGPAQLLIGQGIGRFYLGQFGLR